MRGASPRALRDALLLYAIVDVATVRQCFDGTVVDFARALLAGGARVLQLRDKVSSRDDVTEDAAAIVLETKRAGAYFFVNDYAEIADVVGADGVHVGQEDANVAEVKARYPDLLIGVSARTTEQARSARVTGANYLGCGPIWDARASKSNAPQPIGLEQLRNVVCSVPIPVVGIGGIDATNAAEVLSVGGAGVAMIRALFPPLPPSTHDSDDKNRFGAKFAPTFGKRDAFSVSENVQLLLKRLQNAPRSETTGPLS